MSDTAKQGCESDAVLRPSFPHVALVPEWTYAALVLLLAGVSALKWSAVAISYYRDVELLLRRPIRVSVCLLFPGPSSARNLKLP